MILMIQIIKWYNFHKNFTTKLLLNKIIKHLLHHDQISEWTGLIKYENVMKRLFIPDVNEIIKFWNLSFGFI